MHLCGAGVGVRGGPDRTGWIQANADLCSISYKLRLCEKLWLADPTIIGSAVNQGMCCTEFDYLIFSRFNEGGGFVIEGVPTHA